MAKRDNSDYMSRKMDRELERIERTLSALYTGATADLTGMVNRITAKFQAKDPEMQDLLKNGYITESEYEAWKKRQLWQTIGLNSSIKAFSDILTMTDVVAMSIVDGELPYVIAESYNFVQSLGWKAADDAGLSVGTFQIYNADAVQKLIKDNPRLLPSVDVPKDQKWNMDKINHEITQAIISGDDMEQVAKRLQRVANMDNNTAIRTARTSMTYAENIGRDESYHNLKKKGLPVKKRWSAVLDERTRDTHRQMNGTYANEDDLFGEGILPKDHLLRCPADPNGEPHEIYNCRCREGVVFDKPFVDHSNDDELYEQFMQKNYPQDYKKLKEKDYFNTHSSQPSPKKGTDKKEKAAEQPKPTYKKATNRQEAMDLLKEMGFSKVSNGVKNIDDELFVQQVNRLSELNSRFGAVSKGMELQTGKMKSIAWVRPDVRNGGSDALKFSSNYFNKDKTLLRKSAERNCNPKTIYKSARGTILSENARWWMPSSPDAYDVYSITHEYGHMVQNKLIYTKELWDNYTNFGSPKKVQGMSSSDLIKQYYEKEKFWKDNTEGVKAKMRKEIIAIAKEKNPNFSLDASKNADGMSPLSEYGKKNDDEFFAECFANAFCGSPNELGMAMLEWFRRNGL